MRDDDRPRNTLGFFESYETFGHFVDAPPAEPRVGMPASAPTVATHAAAVTAPPADERIYRPTIRRPMALLHVVDDGREDGEVVRLRSDGVDIGRVEGDVVVPHDVLMSPRHARLDRLAEDGWRLSDLGSATGTFVRVDSARLRHERTIQIGSTRLRFHEVDLTEAWLVEVAPAGHGRRHECHAPETTIGRVGCSIVLDDPFVAEIHAEVRRTHGGWRVRNVGANGLWVRIDEPVVFHAPAQFICGEQRFVFEPLG